MQASVGPVFLVLLLAAVAAAFVTGLWLGARAGRRSAASQADMLAERLRGEGSAELATLRERLRSMEEERQLATLEGQAHKAQAQGLRDALDLARDEKAQLAERSARLPIVEQALGEAQLRLQPLQADVVELKTRLDAERRQSADKLERHP
jgi:DNA recombination protein RmuC